jgi:hypothetical protein
VTSRPLTNGERALSASVFGDAINYDSVTINAHKWWPFQPKSVVMAPDGHIWCHPDGGHYCDDFGACDLGAQGLFIHEMTHVWQHQKGVFLPLKRHPFCRYRYTLKPGKPFARYGIEQQAEIVRHAFMQRQGWAGSESVPSSYDGLLPF